MKDIVMLLVKSSVGSRVAKLESLVLTIYHIWIHIHMELFVIVFNQLVIVFNQ